MQTTHALRAEFESKIDLKLAEQIQQSMLPRLPARLPGWMVDYHFEPAGAVSGDLIDIYQFNDEFFDEENQDPGTSIFLADASGHGVSAALVTMIARQIFFRAFRDYRDQSAAEAVFNANVELKRDLANTGLYLTGVYVRLTANGFHYINCSHPEILFYKKSANKVFALPNDGFLFGTEAISGTLHERKLHCEAGDIIIMHTDGLTEARRRTEYRNPDGTLDFGGRGIIKAIRKELSRVAESNEGPISATRIKESLLNKINKYCGKENPLTDDLTFAVLVKK